MKEELITARDLETVLTDKDVVQKMQRDIKNVLMEGFDVMGDELKVNNEESNLSSIFSDNAAGLNWLFSYVTSNTNIWHKILNKHKNAIGIDFGIRYYVSHYLTIALYSLFIINDSNGDSMLEQGRTKYKKDLSNFYEIMKLFSIYNACFPRCKEYEQFCMKQFIRCTFNVCLLRVCFLFCFVLFFFCILACFGFDLCSTFSWVCFVINLFFVFLS